MRRFRAVLSDIDGTLTESEAIHRAGFFKINANLGVNFEEGELDDTLGLALIDLYDRLKERFDEPISYQDWADRLAAYYVLHADEIEILPGVENVLTRADQAGMDIAAVTNAQRCEADVNIGRLGNVASLIKFTIAVEDMPNPKPAPDGYLAGAERLGVDPKDVLVLEDSPAGVKAAKAAGMTVIQIQSDPKLINKDADLLVTSLDDPRVAAFIGLGPDQRATPPRLTG